MKHAMKNFLLVAATLATTLACAGPREDALAAVERWSAAYTANDLDGIVSAYAGDAILLGTVSPVMSEGSAAIRSYFSRLPGSGNTNTLGDRRFIPVGEDAMVVTGFYVFSNARQEPATPRPSRFTMLVMKLPQGWRIVHHHSSPHVQASN